nr:hypothetical protein [Gammaproteobacteria bacterium]
MNEARRLSFRRTPLFVGVLCIAASACTTTPYIGRPAPPPPSVDVPPRSEEPARPPSDTAPPGETRAAPPLVIERRRPDDAVQPTEPAMPPAAVALLEQSRDQRAAGSYAAAAASIERALRIDPNNAELWLELGEIKLDDGDPQQAEQMARKALTLAGGDRFVASRAERLLTRAASCSRGC